jgi:murein DD-endopeptidase / murein LD-carboxypeptidase
MNKPGRIACLLTAGVAVLFQGCVPPWAISKYYITETQPPRSGTARTASAEQSRLKELVDSYIGTRYVSGGSSRDGVDCSGFVCLIYKELNGTKLPRSSIELYAATTEVELNNAHPGDLIFFNRGSSGSVNHVGIFMGDGVFAHASTSSGVVYNSLGEKYYRERFSGIRRYP